MSRLFNTLSTYHKRKLARLRNSEGRSSAKSRPVPPRASLGNPLSKYGVRRWLNHLARAELEYNAGKALDREQINLLNRKIRKSDVMNYWYPQRMLGMWKPLKDRKFNFTEDRIELRDLSLHSNPIGTIRSLREIVIKESKSAICKINFHDEYCKDLTAYMILSEYWKEMLPIFVGGKMNIPVQKVLTAVGLQAELGIGLNGVRELDDIWSFPLQSRRTRGTSLSKNKYRDIPTRDFAGDKFCDALENWLNALGHGLTSSGRSAFSRVIGELLENAERHSDGGRRDGGWSICGYMAKQREEDNAHELFRVHIGILSLGDTFTESLQRASEMMLLHIEKYLSDMVRVGAPQTRETLTTLACLQDGVTCIPEADDDRRGGYGLMEMVELIGLLTGAETSYPPTISIISGDSCVQLRAPYHKGIRVGGPDKARVQWFNPENSAKQAPDSRWVFDLPEGLPGTAVAVSFTLDPEYLDKSTQKNEQSCG